jgi:hypothetical protein
VYSVYLRASERTFAHVSSNYSDRAQDRVTVNLTTGQVSVVVGSVLTASAQAVGNGIWRIVITQTKASSTQKSFWVETAIGMASGDNSYTGDGTSGIYIWGADLRPADQATGLIGPTYQRVAAATVYDTAGFLPYLAFDGLSWSMGTNSIDFSAGDKMTVWAGVRKLSDAAYGVVTELGNWGTNVNGFAFAAPGSAAPNYSMAMLDTNGDYPTNRYTTYSSPITNVLKCSYDRAETTIATQVVGRINGLNVTASSTVSAPVAASNFGNYPLFIGARNNASLFFTGWLTSLIIRGAQSTQSQIEATEAWVNSRTGAY